MDVLDALSGFDSSSRCISSAVVYIFCNGRCKNLYDLATTIVTNTVTHIGLGADVLTGVFVRSKMGKITNANNGG